MDVKSLLDYDLHGIDENIKCTIKCLNMEVITFNCHTRYEDTAEETIGEIFKTWLLYGGSLKEAIIKRGCTIETIY